MTYTLSIGGEVPLVCWIKDNGETHEVFCNAPLGYDVFAVGPDGERVVDSGDGPTHKAVPLDLREGETPLIRAR